MPLLVMALVFTSCDVQDSTVGTFGDVADKVPNFSAIEGAENVTLKVERNNDKSYFNVNLSNIDKNATIFEGNYMGWCAHWSAPIDTRGLAYDGVTLYSTRGDRNWNKLNYVINNRSRFSNDIDGVTYKEIQAVIWTLINFKEFDIDRNQIFDNLNRDAFNEVLSDVKENGNSFRHTLTTTHAIFADVSVLDTDDEPTQTVIIEGTAWAWAAPHNINSNSFRFHDIGRRWGWVMYYWFYDVKGEIRDPEIGEEFTEEDPFEVGLYAECGFEHLENPEPSDITSRRCRVADAYIWHGVEDDELMLYINIKNKYPEYAYGLTKLHYFLGTELPSRVAPGQLGYSASADGSFDFDLTLTHSLADLGLDEVPDPPAVEDFDENPPVPPLYILIHADTGD